MNGDMEHVNDPTLEYRPEFVFENGAVYKGQWKDTYRHGYGVQIWPDGAKYEGYWKNNKAHGLGKFWHADGDVFDGQWQEDKAHGYGIYTHVNGAKYEGDGKMICSMEKAKKFGKMGLVMMDSIRKDLSMDKESTNGMMAPDTMANGVIIKSMDMESMYGQMADVMKAIGKTIIWKAKVYTHGKMAADMRENIKMIRSTDLVYILGQMAVNITVCGLMESSMVKASIFFLLEFRDVVSGKMDTEFAG
eukprot:CAMPEP_0176354138 /NCGR_PEP_ID=MMETSP0126-20121128/12327_1 /TAXON_ID=141414 ORGANISM="Strombidinopsis acuminatum, Strain SPMC142" /NCGR_SAMPLE_ID=MMETSP0126 /ASSEMBLY_ACC=CAM_ASM_000229 /LENGTH=246 /DNA_ID=CAMNT_0017706153 /DNA_START=228 /DNA_END=969 /DNA_ORIENTATION=+